VHDKIDNNLKTHVSYLRLFSLRAELCTNYHTESRASVFRPGRTANQMHQARRVRLYCNLQFHGFAFYPCTRTNQTYRDESLRTKTLTLSSNVGFVHSSRPGTVPYRAGENKNSSKVISRTGVEPVTDG
jgi:hypothetical protein